MSTTNPLLTPSTLPNKAPPFDQIRQEHYKPAVESAIEQARNNIEAIKANDAAPDFANTIEALETASETLEYVMSVFYNQLTANGNDDMQALAEELGPITSDFSSDVMLDPDLFARIETVYNQRDDLDLTAEQATLLTETYKDFVRGGARLNQGDQQRLREINAEMSTLGPAFMNNVKKSTENYKLVLSADDEVAGLPGNVLETARQTGEEHGHPGKWVFTLDIPSFLPFMQYADRRDLRETIWQAFSSRAYGDAYDNRATITRVIELRHERAKLLGYIDHAGYVLEKRMAGSPDIVWDFLETLLNTYKPAARKDLDDLQELARQQDGIEEIRPWDVAYYAEKLKQARYNFSSEDLRPYFELRQVLKGCFRHFEMLFNLQFIANNDYPVWHADVTAYDVYDADDARFMGTLYADFHPRTGKKDGAWMTTYRDQGVFRGQIERPVVAINCNFTKPAGETPALLTHEEVLTLFHEMGHAIHVLLADTTYQSLSGPNVKWDFVELPSQLQENWLFERETLDSLASHYKTGESIPDDLLDKMQRAKNHLVGWSGLKQVNLSRLDMHWHTTAPEHIHSVESFEDRATAQSSLFPRYGGPFSTAFNHIFAGAYSAGYYSYKWAETLEADAFEMFQENGLYDRETADAYRREVLAKGGTEDPNTLYKRFRGRSAGTHSLLRREGLLDDDSEAA
jgi:peptidyl-dipeptidase Dcp